MINVAVVGIGNIAPAHLQGYLAHGERCRIVALCDIVPQKAERRREALGLTGVDVVASHKELLGREDIDLVSLCTPPGTHAELTVDFLDAGKDVLVEKPMAPSLADCDAMLAARDRSGRLLSVVAQNRFRDDMATLKAAIDSGLIGPVAHLAVDSAWWRGVPYYDLAWRGTWESEGGGPTLNHAIHHIDLLLWMMGGPQAVQAMMTNAWHDNAEVEDLSVALLRYERAIAQLTSSVAQPWAVRAEVTQPNGFPTADGNAALVEQLEAIASAHVPLPHQGHAGQIGDVLDAVEQRRAPAVTAEDGRRTVEVVTAIYRAAIERREVELPIRADSEYHTRDGLLANAPRFFTKSASVEEQEGFITAGGSTGPLA